MGNTANTLKTPEAVLGCVGLSVDGVHDLTDKDWRIIIGIASDLHRMNGWRAPPCPFRLAALEGVLLYELGPEEMSRWTPECAFYPVGGSDRCTGLFAAHALAGSISLRRRIKISAIGVWALAAELLVPAWAHEADLSAHPQAPPWLVNLRRPKSAWLESSGDLRAS